LGLVRRWQAAFADDDLWRFRPVPVHGDLGADDILVSGARVVAISGWPDARVADPADDLAWLLATVPSETTDTIMDAYRDARTDFADEHIVDRALLIGELELARWLLYGVRQNDRGVIADAEEMLVDLDNVIRAADHDNIGRVADHGSVIRAAAPDVAMRDTHRALAAS
jgi:aminoglycoside phosphotransferase (APT) family kinase protein